MLLSYGEEDSVAPKNITSCYINDNQIYSNVLIIIMSIIIIRKIPILITIVCLFGVYFEGTLSVNHLTEERSFTPTDNIPCCQLE